MADTNPQSPDDIAQDINTVSIFLANSQILSLKPPITTTSHKQIKPSTVVLAGSAILHTAQSLFTYLESQLDSSTDHSEPSSITTIVISGGIGHSTSHLYTAILNHPIYSALPSYISELKSPSSSSNFDLETLGLSEAHLLNLIFVHFHNGRAVVREWNHGLGLRVLLEEKSTNCGANAVESLIVLEREGVRVGGEDVVIVQDPTMSLRSLMSFERVFGTGSGRQDVRFWCWPTFVPRVRTASLSAGDGEAGEIAWDAQHPDMNGVDVRGLWDMARFYGLLLGEIPRLRDDENGYGPQGKGFIGHVDVPSQVENAWQRLKNKLEHKR